MVIKWEFCSLGTLRCTYCEALYAETVIPEYAIPMIKAETKMSKTGFEGMQTFLREHLSFHLFVYMIV